MPNGVESAGTRMLDLNLERLLLDLLLIDGNLSTIAWKRLRATIPIWNFIVLYYLMSSRLTYLLYLWIDKGAQAHCARSSPIRRGDHHTVNERL